MAPQVEFLAARGIPVCGHIGLTPQSVNALGGWKIQGKTEDGARALVLAAKALENTGASLIVLELVPATVGQKITAVLRIPTKASVPGYIARARFSTYTTCSISIPARNRAS